MSKRKLQYPTELPHWKGVHFLPDNKGVQKTDSWGDERRVSRTVSFLNYLKNNPHPTIVPILDYRVISYREYSYDMPLMAELSDSESELVGLFTEASEGSVYRAKNRHKIYRLGKKHPKLYQVIKKLNSWKTYIDLHEGNVMKDQYGNIKLIDIEGFGFSRYSFEDIVNDITARR